MKFKPVAYLSFFCFVPLLLALGFWQLNRAEEKRQRLNSQALAQNQETVALKTQPLVHLETLLYRNLSADGRYDEQRQYLLDNQIHQGKAGYFVLTPFLLNGGSHAVLVNRGWLPLGQSRAELPKLNFETATTRITGRLNRFPSVGIRLADDDVPNSTWPKVIQVADTGIISRQLGYPVQPFQVELAVAEPNGYVRDWRKPSAMPPEKHTAYAVQWFLLAATLTVLTVKYGRQNHHA